MCQTAGMRTSKMLTSAKRTLGYALARNVQRIGKVALRPVFLMVSPPKTRNSIRTLAIPQQAVDLLIAEHKKHPRNPYLFPSPKTGTMYDPDAFRRTYDKILKAIGAEHIRLHNLRHTFATLSPRSGVDVKTLSGAFQPFPRVGQVVSLEETAKIKRLKKLRIGKKTTKIKRFRRFLVENHILNPNRSPTRSLQARSSASHADSYKSIPVCHRTHIPNS